MDGSAYVAAASVLVAVIGAGSAELARRAAAKAARRNTVEEIEKEAYERAEAMLDRQFKRQEEEIEGLHEDVRRLEKKVRDLEADRDEDRRSLAESEAQIRTYAAILAARGIDLP